MSLRVDIFHALCFCLSSLAVSSVDNTCVGDSSGTCSDASALLQSRVKVSQDLVFSPDGNESFVERDTTVEAGAATGRYDCYDKMVHITNGRGQVLWQNGWEVGATAADLYQHELSFRHEHEPSGWTISDAGNRQVFIKSWWETGLEYLQDSGSFWLRLGAYPSDPGVKWTLIPAGDGKFLIKSESNMYLYNDNKWGVRTTNDNDKLKGGSEQWAMTLVRGRGWRQRCQFSSSSTPTTETTDARTRETPAKGRRR